MIIDYNNETNAYNIAVPMRFGTLEDEIDDREESEV